MQIDKNEKLMTKAETCEYLNLSDSTLFRLRRDSMFPNPLQLGARTIRWKRQDIDDYLVSITPDQPCPSKHKVKSKRSLN
ncbi:MULTISPECIES: helix-turn-helix transcriptional regulator [unclassified Colwellia]|jgi:prophage regulatory protein|uniref:helix-turn-helix transcriptional regulator n=1 Tax=unclassified Colwellia TaxID=196834 RepID=UPI0015F4BA62|nr:MULTISPECIES: AlpA family phage regulatory protein [unclassified Colwellia]MBA6232178.1 AlpA family phage regulatory protein [Colwellia sp. MB02u-7]MBA6237124.1 AlpA family phage regulatory protein [Colwellia sp. MB02u-11]MBA6301612.1 AlpA family phage regulatory protein [Colwellia sp. MB3u-22]MBA6311498.1 AlpA family phage regulatory protein [Colwellia sp. MB3u-64]